MQSKQKQIMVELYFSTIHDHIKMLNIKLGTICALKNLVFVTDQDTLIVISQSDHSDSNILSSCSFFSANFKPQCS